MDKTIGELIAAYLLEDDESQPLHPDLEKWLSESSSNRSMFDEYKKIWVEISHYTPADDFDAMQVWDELDRINRNKKKENGNLFRIGYAAASIAASILLFAGLYASGFLVRPDSQIVVGTTTNYGNRSEIFLPDGSHVRLNTGTSIQYTYNRKKDTREIDFQGEAFFEVAKKDAPFIIHTPDGLKVKVLGTTFGLSAYKEDNEFQLSLLEGSVELSDANSSLTLQPGEAVSYDRATGQMRRIDGDIAYTYGWMDNKLYMDNMSLSDICKRMERWYDVQISLSPELGDSLRYTGVLQEETILDVLNALRSLSKIKYEMNGRQIRITSK